MRLQVLVSSVNKEFLPLASTMKLCSDAVMVNQGDYDGFEKLDYSGNTLTCISMKERGVGLSRNTAFKYADAQVCLFSDEDIVLEEDYEDKIVTAHEDYPEADVILFNVKVDPSRRTYWNDTVTQIGPFNYGRYPAYSISVKRQSLEKSGVKYSLLFGGGAKYSNGEDSLFLHDCLKAHLKIIALPICIGEEIPRPSTWFKGYTEKFFYDRGVLYHYLYGVATPIWGFRFVFKNRREMCKDIPFFKAYKLLLKGSLARN